jgi:hypothetical protein
VAYGARLESVLGATPRGFESRILRFRNDHVHHPYWYFTTLAGLVMYVLAW